MKEDSEVVSEFNDYVNMSASELEKWLKTGDSQDAGWSKDDNSGESVGHDSGRKIIDILKSNPKKDPKKYTDDQIQHMRKVVSYCKRHLAQEEKMIKEKTAEEVKKTKSYASLKNWGHDPLKYHFCHEEEDENEDPKDDANKEGEEDKQAGDKRKASNNQNGTSKKRETRKGAGNKTSNGNKKKGEKDEEDEDEEEDDSEHEQDENGEDDDDDEQDEDDDNEEEESGQKGSGGKKPKKGPKPGDTVSWNWGSGQPEGKVLDVKAEKASITTKRGNEVTRDGDPEDPAVIIDAGKSKAIKMNHELN